MTHVMVTKRTGETLTIHAEEGISLMESIRAAGIDEVLALCGGCCSCATCHVIVDPSQSTRLSPMNSDEGDLLDSTGNRVPTSRLSCQICVTSNMDGLRVTIAPEA